MNRSDLADHYKAVRARMGIGRSRPVVMLPNVETKTRRLPRVIQPSPPPPLPPPPPPALNWNGLPSINVAPVEIIHAPVSRAPTVLEIKSAVAGIFGVTIRDLDGDRRTGPISRARVAGYYLCRTLTRRSTPQIAAAFKRCDHTTVLSGVKSARRLIEVDPRFAASVSLLTQILTSGAQAETHYWGA